MKIAQDQQDGVKTNILRWLEEGNYEKWEAIREKSKREESSGKKND